MPKCTHVLCVGSRILNEAADMRAIGASWDKKPELRFVL